MTVVRWLGRVVAGAIGAGVALGAVAVVAGAHPFGDPQSVTLSADSDTVRVVWSAPPDDLQVLGGVVGALPERREFVFEASPDGSPEPVGETDADRLRESDELAAYLANAVTVRQGGTSCSAEVDLDGVVDDGAVLTFRCPDEVTEVDVGVAILTDVHEAYRTVAVGDGTTDPGRALYTVDDSIRSWRFHTEPVESGVSWVVPGGAAVAALAGAAVVLLARRSTGVRGMGDA